MRGIVGKGAKTTARNNSTQHRSINMYNTINVFTYLHLYTYMVPLNRCKED